MEEKDERVEQPQEEEYREASSSHKEHHHHHGGHHSRRHHKHHKKRNSRSGFRKFIKKNKKTLLPIATILLVLVIMFAVLGVVELISANRKPTETQAAQGTDGIVIIAVPVFEEKVPIAGDAAKTLVNNSDFSIPAHVVLQNYAAEGHRLDISQVVKLDFRISNQPQDYVLDSIAVRLADNQELREPWSYTMESLEDGLEVSNLKGNTKYYYEIRVRYTNGVEVWAGGSFETEAAPRILTVDGIRNVRDVGGWQTTDGKTVRQGLLYRGTELDGTNDEFRLTDEGRQFMLEKLGIRTDLDLRWSKEIPKDMDPLGDTVNHICYGTAQYTGIFLDTGKESVRKIFSDLANEKNYPIYMHCIYGRDRTGTVCALLEAVLGVSEDDIHRDYQLSALHNRNLDSAFWGFMEQLNTFEGADIREKAENYLLSIGVTPEEITAIRTIFLY